MKKAIQIVCATVLVAALGSAAMAVEIETVPVGNVDNAGEWSGESYGGRGPNRKRGTVNYSYNIGKYEVTAGQYCEFLNAVAGVDTYDLYNGNMWHNVYGCGIERYDGGGTSGDPYQYRVDVNSSNRPVNFVNFWDACRFANWLHNDQPTGAQNLSSTEDGAYFLGGALSPLNSTVTRKGGWKWAIPSENEWYKAAYHKNDGPTGNYFDYPTSSDTAPGYVNNSGNLSGTGDPFTESGTDPGNYATYDDDGLRDGIGSPYWHTEVGEWENSASPYGTFDQGGNITEWNEAIVAGERGFRGGGINSGALGLSAPYLGNNTPGHAFSTYGFRVAQASAPIADANGPYFLAAGEDLQLDGSGSNSVSPIVSWLWDLDGDGQYDDAVGETANIPFAYWSGMLGWQVEGQYMIALEIHALDGRVDWDSVWVGIPEPATLSLLALGGLAVLRTRRRTHPNG